VSDDGMTDEKLIGKYLEGNSCGLSEVLSQHLPVRNHENLMIAGVPAKNQTEHVQNTSLG
jgi:hypothetical protein